MISTEELLYDIDLRLNKVATNEHQSIPVEDKIIALNGAQIKIIKQKLGENNIYKMGLDSFRKRYDDLQFLVVYKDNLNLELQDTITNKYTVSIDNLEPEYMFYIDSFVTADKGNCKNRVLHPIMIAHSDVWLYTQNSLTKPSFEYQETLSTISDNKFEIYSDGTFTPKFLQLHYIRRPKYIDYVGYIHFDGKPSTTIDSEFPYQLLDEVVDAAILDLAMSTENNAAVQYSNMRIATDE